MQQLSIRMNLYRFIYLFQGLWGTFVASYLPVYFTNVLHIPAVILASIVLGQSPLILKPIFGILADKYPAMHSPRRGWLLLGSAILIGGLIGVILLVGLLISGLGSLDVFACSLFWCMSGIPLPTFSSRGSCSIMIASGIIPL